MQDDNSSGTWLFRLNLHFMLIMKSSIAEAVYANGMSGCWRIDLIIYELGVLRSIYLQNLGLNAHVFIWILFSFNVLL